MSLFHTQKFFWFYCQRFSKQQTAKESFLPSSSEQLRTYRNNIKHTWCRFWYGNFSVCGCLCCGFAGPQLLYLRTLRPSFAPSAKHQMSLWKCVCEHRRISISGKKIKMKKTPSRRQNAFKIYKFPVQLRSLPWRGFAAQKIISCAAIKVVFLNVCVCVCSKDMYMLHVCVYFIKCKWHFIFMEKTTPICTYMCIWCCARVGGQLLFNEMKKGNLHIYKKTCAMSFIRVYLFFSFIFGKYSPNGLLVECSFGYWSIFMVYIYCKCMGGRYKLKGHCERST